MQVDPVFHSYFIVNSISWMSEFFWWAFATKRNADIYNNNHNIAIGCSKKNNP